MRIDRNLFDDQDRPVPLGNRLGRGGEGSVFAVNAPSELAAKVYPRPCPPEQAAKLAAMVALRSERLLALAAWPVATLHAGVQGPVQGFLMPRAAGRAIHLLYGPKSRLTAFPRARFSFLVHAAANLARAFAVVHAHGHAIGDVNHGNVFVSDEATVRLIDCDSFQVAAPGRTFPCTVGVATHLPPELQGRSLNVPRTANHDAFGLAVLVFQLLFMGRHPFSGRFQGGGDMPVERAIRELRFAYGRDAARNGMLPPPNTLPLAATGPQVTALFERAFAAEGLADGGRPRAEEWVDGLGALARELQACRRNPAHSYPRHLPSCPWCAIEAQTGALLFLLAPGTAIAGGGFALAAVWAQIAAVPSPGAAPHLPPPLPWSLPPSPEALRAGRQRRVRRTIAWAFGIVGVLVCLGLAAEGGWAALFPVLTAALAIGFRTGSSRLALKDCDDARWRLSTLNTVWNREAGDGAFRAKLEDLAAKRTAHQRLPDLRRQQLAELQANRREKQLARFLDRFRLEHAKIDGIGPSRKTALQSYGIETAADLVEARILAVPDFGPSRTATLLAWRRALERRFVFKPDAGIDPADLAALDRRVADARSALERDLAAGPAELRRLAQLATHRRHTLAPQLEAAARALAQADLDLRTIEGKS